MKTGGAWDADDRYKIFIAGNERNIVYASLNKNVLVAVEKSWTEKTKILVESIIESGRDVLIDSGVFTLTNEHKRAHGCTMDEALALAPDDIDGFDVLMDQYLDVVGRFGARSWGYIEVDQGGRENKVKTRAFLEGRGLRPIPVYHPLNDGWDYFDELASKYDRICLGNVVHADRPTRVRLMAALVKRREKYPGLWVHGLGVAPTTKLPMSLPLDSIDASYWLAPLRYPRWPVSAGMTRSGLMPVDFWCRFDADDDGPDGHRFLTKLCGYDMAASETNWRNHLAASARESSS